jgi:hypothetical protein
MRHQRHGHHIPNAPSRPIWVISLILGLLGILLHYRVIQLPSLLPHSFEIELLAFVLLAIGTTLRGI